MSELERQDREWRSFITDMIESGEKVLSYTAGVDVHEFLNDPLTYDATLWNLRIIGEAATHIPHKVRDPN